MTILGHHQLTGSYSGETLYQNFKIYFIENDENLDIAAQQYQIIQQFKPRPPPAVSQDSDEVVDFSCYSTNVAERLWRAKKEAEKLGVTASPSLVPLAREYQQWRKEMGILSKCIDEYKEAMEELCVKRNQVNTQGMYHIRRGLEIFVSYFSGIIDSYLRILHF